MRRFATRVFAAALLLLLPAVTGIAGTAQAYSADEERIRQVAAILSEMAAESRVASARTRAAYRTELELALRDRPALIESLESGELARLPRDPRRYNLELRLSGSSPIAERDLVYQPLYVAARPATIGALLAVANRVQSGPLEITSLVRHREYQQALRRSNPNASTTVPTHTMGLAFDISVLNTPIDTVREIRDVLRAMSEAGDIFVIAETRQLVFHVVPTPARLGFFEALYDSVMTLSPEAFPEIVIAGSPTTE